MKKLYVSVLLSVMVFTSTASAAPAETFLRLPVMVLSGDKAVENLTIDDFNLSIAGHKTEIAHLIKINRTLSEANSPRNFVLAFNIKDYYGQQIDDAISYFVDHILKEGDSLLLWTPVKVYVISTNKDKNTITETIKDLVKKDTLDFKKNLANAITTLNDIINKYKVDSVDKSGDTYLRSENPKYNQNVMTASNVFLSNYYRELTSYRNRFILPNILKTREIAGLLAEKNGQKWMINFQERDIVPNYSNYKEVAVEISDFAERVQEKNVPETTRMWKIIELIDKLMLLTENTPTKEITTALQNANISYNAILLRSTRERTSMGDTVGQDVDETFKDFAHFTGGTAVVTTDLIEGLDMIRKASTTYYDLIFKVRNQDKELAVSVGLPKKFKAKAYYKQLYTKKEMDTIFAALEGSGIKIDGVDLKDQKLKFSLSGYQLTTPGNNNQGGLINVLVNLFDEKNAVVYKTQKTMKSQEKTIEFSMEMPEKYKGDFTLSINAVDLLSLKSTQMNQYVKL